MNDQHLRGDVLVSARLGVDVTLSFQVRVNRLKADHGLNERARAVAMVAVQGYMVGLQLPSSIVEADVEVEVDEVAEQGIDFEHGPGAAGWALDVSAERFERSR